MTVSNSGHDSDGEQESLGECPIINPAINTAIVIVISPSFDNVLDDVVKSLFSDVGEPFIFLMNSHLLRLVIVKFIPKLLKKELNNEHFPMQNDLHTFAK